LEKKKHIILIPVYNDWESLNKLLSIIDKNITYNDRYDTEVLILNDRSIDPINLKKVELNSIKRLSVLSVKKNLGSQKIIAIGLEYINNKNKNIVTIIDSDGEDNPLEINKMLKLAEMNENFVITSNRLARKESFLIISLYKAHLFLTFIFCLKWVSFGNFTSFDARNINKIMKDKSSWYAHSASVIKNCKIKRLYAKRESRYFGKSKLSILKLIEHSLRINAVFIQRVILMSMIYIILFSSIINNILFVSCFILILIIYNMAIILTKIKHHISSENKLDEFIEKVELI
tara:strand:- start:191 stop:1057 length:867 start_codon:yes stop_codon:yes gene_type:complete